MFCELEGLVSVVYFSVDRRMQQVIEELKIRRYIDVVRRDKSMSKVSDNTCILFIMKG
jgi:hypothetical protein